MRTPKIYNDYLKNRVITAKMLGDALYSVNKRAKNARDNKNKYRNRSDVYDNFNKYREIEIKYYNMKGIMLSLIKPLCIHESKMHREIDIVVDEIENGDGTDEDYDFFRDVEYFDTEEGFYVQLRKYYKTIEEVSYLYFLYYEVDGKSFHTPISEKVNEPIREFENIKAKGLVIKSIDELITGGKEIQDLLSVQFTNKIVDLIKTKEFTYKP